MIEYPEAIGLTKRLREFSGRGIVDAIAGIPA